MRKWAVIVRATALEVLSEPLSLLVLLAALVLAVFAPAFHYHQFGEADRMARDAGCSALLMGGLVVSVFGTIRSYRREIESGTMQMALAHAISRGGFFVAKFLGVLLAYLVFALIVFMTTQVIVEGAVVGGRIARETGDIARIFGPHLATGVAILLLPLIVSAALNRFARFRFVLSSVLIAAGLSTLAGLVAIGFYPSLVVRYLPAAALIAAYTIVVMAFGAAFAVRFKAHGAVTATVLALAATVPAVGNYYLTEALSGAQTLPPGYVAAALAASLPAIAAALMLGAFFMERNDD